MARGTDDVPGSAEELSLRPLDYFSHDSGAFHDIKCRVLVRRRGMEGYGMWWRLCELLAAADGHSLDVSDGEVREIVAEELRCDGGDSLLGFLGDLAEVGLIDPELFGKGIVASERMSRNALSAARKRYAGMRSAAARKAR